MFLIVNSSFEELCKTNIHKNQGILSEFNLVLNKGDKAVIIGEEGNGKSTLMKWIYNPLLIDNYIEAEGERLVGKEILGYIPQEISEEDKEKTIYEFFSAEEMFWNRTPKELSEITGKFGMTSEFFYSDQKMGSLSGGEKVKAHIMRLIIQDVTVLLLDEPSNDIDINTLEILEKKINDWCYNSSRSINWRWYCNRCRECCYKRYSCELCCSWKSMSSY